MDKEKLLKELDNIDKQLIYNLKWDSIDDIFKELRKIALEIGADDLLEDYIDYEMLRNLVTSELKENGVEGVRLLLHNVWNASYDFYYLNKYGEAINIYSYDLSDLWAKLSDRVKEL